MIETAVVVAYLSTWLLKGGKRWADRRFDDALEGLWKRVVDELHKSGRGREISQFRKRPRNAYTRESLEQTLREATKQNPTFGASLEANVDYLDSRNGRRFIIIVDDDPITSRVWWVRGLVALAAVLMFGGFGVIFSALFQDNDQNFARGFAVFFVGLCVLALSGFAHQLTKTRLD